MKKQGILNAQLMGELTKIRHEDIIVICDIGFPIPKGSNVVDVSLVEGLPTFPQVLKAVLNEIIVESYTFFDIMKKYNEEYYQFLQDNLVNQAWAELSMPEFVARSQEAKLFIRTGEAKPASNIMLRSASGVAEASKQFDVHFPSIL